MLKDRVIETELGQEARCAQCGEFWPADAEFFFMTRGKPHSWCKACYAVAPSTAAKRQRWAEKQKAVREAAKALQAHQAPAGAIVSTSRSDTI